MSPRSNRKRRERRKKAKFVKKEETCSTNPSLEGEKNSADSLHEEFDCVTVAATLDHITVKASSIQDDFFILGEGSFGLVTLGVLHYPNGRRERVALKAPHNYVLNHVLLEEAKIMMSLEHPNIVKLVALQRGPLKIAIEYMNMGDILDALKQTHFSDSDLLRVLQDVATGMEYIAEKKYVHMDLACRNVFINSKKQAKIGDFGLTKYVGHRSDGVFILRTGIFHNLIGAPEAISLGRYSTKSDVFSMGILTWELYFAATNGPVLLKKIMLETFCTLGCALPQPQRCPDDLFRYVIKKLLNDSPDNRPSFTDVKNKLTDLL